MLTRMAHRGPDGEGKFFEQGVSLGMRRLAVMDVAGGGQPYRSEDGRVVAVFNGEIYNYPELAGTVSDHGHRLISRADGEVLVHLYEMYGSDMVTHLRGMFAFALWDSRHQRLLLARDHVGQKPLYVLENTQTIAFASELKAFYGLEHWRAEVDPAFLASYLGHRYVPAPFTLVQGVTKLQPGEATMFYGNGRRQRWFYWQPPLIEPLRAADIDRSAGELDALLTTVVQEQLAADVPIGLFLSGGLDSSLIAAMAGAAGRRLKAWTAVFPPAYPGCDESEWASEVAGRWALPLERVEVDWNISAERLKQLAYILDEPMADPTVLPLDGLARAVGGQTVVVLSGEGADEMFAGYAGYGEPASLKPLDSIPPLMKRAWIALGGPGSGALRRTLTPMSQRYRGVGFTFDQNAQEALLRREWMFPDRPEAIAHYWSQMAATSPLQAMQGFDLKWFLADDVLLKTDRIGMHHHLEIRTPFCDHRIVEWAMRSPLALRRNNHRDKWILRQVAKRYLPRTVVERPKRGFPTPLTAWLSGPLQEIAWDTLAGSRLMLGEWLKPEAIRAFMESWRRLKRPNSQLSRQVYALLMLEFWLQSTREQNSRHRAQVEPARES